jgi:PEP-CTERM motif
MLSPSFQKDPAFELYTRVPEPATLVLIASGSIALIAFRRRK